MMDAPQIGWVVSELILGCGLVLFVVPCWRLLWQYRHEHHRITWACLLLVIPDLVQVCDFIPIHMVDLVRGVLVDDAYCKGSAFVIVACILASNGGNMLVAWTTKRMLDPADQKVTGQQLLLGAATSWVLGLLLAGYFLGQGYLGSHRGVYCCTNQVARWDIAGPVFLCYGVCIVTMAYFYRKAWRQVHSTVFPSNQRSHPRGVVSAAGNSEVGGSRDKEGGVEGAGSASPRGGSAAAATATTAFLATSSPLASPNSRATRTAVSPASPTTPVAATGRVSSASSAVARRAVLMVGVYYACWFLICLNAIYELSGWSDRSLWWDIVAKWLAKCQPAIDAFILSQSIIKAQERKTAMKSRAAAGGPQDSQGGSSGAAPARSPTAATSPKLPATTSSTASRPTPRGPQIASPRDAAQRPKVGGVIEVRGALHPPPKLDVSSNGGGADEPPGSVAAAESRAESAAAAEPTPSPPPPESSDGLHHRRTMSSDIATY